MSEEEKRLIKGYFNDGYCCNLDELKEIANKMIDQLQQKENIIKEVREYINYYGTTPEQNDDQTLRYILKGILEILDKEKE